MCHTVPVTANLDHTIRASWAADEHAVLPAHALHWLRERTGAPGNPTITVSADEIPVPESALSEDARAALAEVVGAEYVLLGRDDRLGRATGLSYVDLIRRRAADSVPVPDAVVLPADAEQVQRVLDVCVAHDIAVVPFGGGTSVVGGVSALRGDKSAVLALDLVRLNTLVSVDPVSRLAVLGAGLRAPEAEQLLAVHGFTLGHVPQSFERATIGGFAATRSAGQASAGYGRFEDMVQGVRLATPVGEWTLGGAPASAAGPDLRRLVIGSEGAFGVITEVTVRIRPLPKVTRYEGLVVDGWARGAEAIRTLAQQRVLADVTRLSDMDETAVGLALSGGMKVTALRKYLAARGISDPCLLILGWEAQSAAELSARRSAARRALRSFRPVNLGRPLGATWKHGRFNGPRQRDALLDAGIMVETLETATHWSRLDELYRSVRSALVEALTTAGRQPVVMCHISHAYETGASLYFTAIMPQDDDPVPQWQRAKAAACAAIADRGDQGQVRGTITHHHALGVDHLPWLAGEVGERGIEVIAAVKRELDPSGILNPGKLGSKLG